MRVVHGGLHDLTSGNARFVHDALRAREALLRERPHLVQPLPVMLPVYAGDPQPRMLRRAQFVALRYSLTPQSDPLAPEPTAWQPCDAWSLRWNRRDCGERTATMTRSP